MQAVFASSDVLTRRIVFNPATKADAHSAVPPGLIPLNSPLVPKPLVPGKPQVTGNGLPHGNGRIGRGNPRVSPDGDLVLSWPGPRKVVSLLPR